MFKAIAVGAGALALVTACSVPSQASSVSQYRTRMESAAKVKAELPVGTYGDGDYVVGTDIQPGTYHTTGPGEENVVGMCYWARTRGLSGELKDIISNNNIQGASTIQIKATDKGVQFHNGCFWSKIG